jgi:hypothetical protein
MPMTDSPSGNPERLPGRRPVKREYLAALAGAVPPDTWREICRATVEAAKAGDAKARDWLARYLIGDRPLRLLHLAADERGAYSAEDEIDQERRSREHSRMLRPGDTLRPRPAVTTTDLFISERLCTLDVS